MNVVLIGMMGSGKSTVGRLLARDWHRPFFDTDTLVELGAGKLIRQIFETEGEAGFRARERAAVQEAVAGDRRVIATGGGTVLDPENRALLRKGALVFWLDAEPEELCRRALRQGAAARPLLAGPDPEATLRRLYAERALRYAQAAHIRIDVSGRRPEEVAADIRLQVEAHEGDTEGCRKSP